MLSDGLLSKALHFHPFLALELCFNKTPTIITVFKEFNLRPVLLSGDLSHLYISLTLFFLLKGLACYKFCESWFSSFDSSL